MTATPPATLLDLVLADPHCPERGILSDLWTECPDMRPDLDLRGAEVVYRDGDAVPWGIRATMAQWCDRGGECSRCKGRGQVTFGEAPNLSVLNCGRCDCTGRIESLAASVCRAWPVVNVVLVDKTPEHWVSDVSDSTVDCSWSWHNVENVNEMIVDMAIDAFEFEFQLPAVIFNRLRAPKSMNQQSRRTGVIAYPSKSRAIAALSHTALALGRQRAGLPPL